MKEFKNGQRVEVLLSGDWHKADYIGISGDSHVVKDFYFAYQAVGNDRIRKESPSFEDVEIDWIEDIGYIRNEDGDTIGVHNLSICSYLTFGTLSRYVFDAQGNGYGGKFTADTPMMFNADGTEIEIKATHARFVKIN